MAPLRIDPVAEARRHWEQRWGPEPSRPMAAVTSIMRAQQVLMARLNELVKPHGLTFPRYEALVLLSYTRHGEL
ncbi:MAG TPA: MarR family transcriptional regulator, partial [Baekduia sp.]|nr:MarR family transcriptional regulator [Baekduia sp.]